MPNKFQKSKKAKRKLRMLQWQSQTRRTLIAVAKVMGTFGIMTIKALDSLPTRSDLWRAYSDTYSVWGRANPRTYYQMLRRLREWGYLKSVSGGMIELTKKGQLEIVRQAMEEKQDPNQWDGNWRLMMFDIPEKWRDHRALLRRHLFLFGFRKMQQSVWVTPYAVEEEMRELVKLLDLNLEGKLRFAVVHSFDKESDLRKKFKLKTKF